MVFGCLTVFSVEAQTTTQSLEQSIRKTKLKSAAYESVVSTFAEDEDGLDITKEEINGFSVEFSYGDLTGDNKEEAAVFVDYYVGGTGPVNVAKF